MTLSCCCRFCFVSFKKKNLENPILCMDELSKLFALMEVQETRLLGIAHCIVPKEEEFPIIESDFVPPNELTPELMPELVPELMPENDNKQNPEQNPTILQTLMPKTDQSEKLEDDTHINASDVPSVILSSIKNSLATANDEHAKTTEISPPNPDENNVDIVVTHVEKLNDSIESNNLNKVSAIVPLNSGNDTDSSSINFNNKLENKTVLEAISSSDLKSSMPQTTEFFELSVPSTSPSPTIAEIVLGEMESVSKSPESDSDNYIYETFSQVNIDTSHQRNEHVVLPEPPEIPNTE